MKVFQIKWKTPSQPIIMIGIDPKRYKTSKDTTSFIFKNQLKPKNSSKSIPIPFTFLTQNFRWFLDFGFDFTGFCFLHHIFTRKRHLWIFQSIFSRRSNSQKYLKVILRWQKCSNDSENQLKNPSKHPSFFWSIK